MRDRARVTFIQNDRFVKIGRARNVRARLYGTPDPHPHELRLVGVIACEAAAETELAWHRQHAAMRVRGEWFHLDGVLLSAIREAGTSRRINH